MSSLSPSSDYTSLHTASSDVDYENMKEIDPFLDSNEGSHMRSFETINGMDVLRRRLNIFGGVLVLSLIVNAITLGTLGATRNSDVFGGEKSNWVEWKGIKPVWSPATNVIEHQHQLSATFTQVSKYSAPRTIEGDDAWEELYLPYYWQALPRSMVKDTLVNRTARPPGDEEYYGEPRYVIGLDVFHKIHCLDLIRRKLYPPPPGADPNDPHHPHLVPPVSKPGEPPYDHVDHCINSLRESLMCQPDITPVPWQWHADENRYRVGIDVVHSCTNFEKLQEWGEEWKLRLRLNFTQEVPDSWDLGRQLPELASWH